MEYLEQLLTDSISCRAVLTERLRNASAKIGEDFKFVSQSMHAIDFESDLACKVLTDLGAILHLLEQNLLGPAIVIHRSLREANQKLHRIAIATSDEEKQALCNHWRFVKPTEYKSANRLQIEFILKNIPDLPSEVVRSFHREIDDIETHNEKSKGFFSQLARDTSPSAILRLLTKNLISSYGPDQASFFLYALQYQEDSEVVHGDGKFSHAYVIHNDPTLIAQLWSHTIYLSRLHLLKLDIVLLRWTFSIVLPELQNNPYPEEMKLLHDGTKAASALLSRINETLRRGV